MQPATRLPFCPAVQAGNRIIVCSVEAIRLSRELGGEGKAEADVVVPILRRVVVPIDGTAVHRVVDPAAAAQNAVRPLL
ncbi:MAG: hypothetical protein WGN25_12430 [Candidatus Electrothrix sp. GW3-4]|uniref:hypothetical protein n=1 Tax=Candidatus Electrothrix sp. GW3-4 TaxID=3126740 RepID=UPI0030CDD0DB